MKLILMAASTISLSIASVHAQNAGDTLKGTWGGPVQGSCREVTLMITGVEADGTVRGAFNCKGHGWNATLGDKIDSHAMAAKFTDGKLRVHAQRTGSYELAVVGSNLEGTSWTYSDARLSKVSLAKQ